MHKRSISQGCEAAEADEENGEREISGEEGSNKHGMCINYCIHFRLQNLMCPLMYPRAHTSSSTRIFHSAGSLLLS